MKKKRTKKTLPKKENVDSNKPPAIFDKSMDLRKFWIEKFVKFGSLIPNDTADSLIILSSLFKYIGNPSVKCINESMINLNMPQIINPVIKMSINMIAASGNLLRDKKLLSGEKTKNKKYAITNGIKIWLSSFSVSVIAIMPIIPMKNFTDELLYVFCSKLNPQNYFNNPEGV